MIKKIIVISVVFIACAQTIVYPMKPVPAETSNVKAGGSEDGKSGEAKAVAEVEKEKKPPYWGDGTLTWWLFQALNGELDTITTEEIKLPDKEIYWDHAKLRLFMGGDKAQYQAVFKEAVKNENAVLQIALVNAYNFELVHDHNVLSFRYKAYEKLGCEVFHGTWRSDESFIRRIVEKAYEKAAAENFPHAVVVQAICSIVECNNADAKDVIESSLREKLRVLAITGYPGALAWYGRVLLWDKQSSEEQQCQGFKYMYRSGLLIELCPHPTGAMAGTDWGYFKSRTEAVPPGRSWCEYGGMQLFKESDKVLVPYAGYLAQVYTILSAVPSAL